MKTITLSFYSKGSFEHKSEGDLLTDVFSNVQIVIINFRPHLRVHVSPGDLFVPSHRSNILDILRGTPDGRNRDSLRARWILLGHQRERTQRPAVELNALVAQEQANRLGQPGRNDILAFPDYGTYVGGDQHRNRILVYDLQGLLWFILGRNQDHFLPDRTGCCGVLHGTQRVLVSPQPYA